MKIPIIGLPLEYTLKIASLWPGQSNLFGLALMMSAIFTMMPFQALDALRVMDNPVAFMDNLSDILSEILLYIKFTVIWWHKRHLTDLLREMSDDYQSMEMTIKWSSLVRFSRRFCNFDYATYIGASSMYYVQFGILYTQVPVEKRQMILKAHYPFDYQSSPAYEILNAVQLVQGLLMCSIQAVSECLLVALVAHASSQIELLLDEIELYTSSSKAYKKPRSMVSLIRKHIKVLNLIDKIESIYCYVSLAQLSLSTLTICSTAFVLMTMTGTDEIEVLVKYVTLYLMWIWQVFSFCYCGQHLVDKSEIITRQLYNILWYDMSPKTSKMIFFMMKRSQIPLNLTAGKFVTLSSTSFTLIIKTSFSYLSVLRANYV